MHRCIELAMKGAGTVAPNPMVGAVLVHGDRIIGEGYHRQYGQAHAEVECLAAVRPEDQHLISGSTLYVSLEPCAHFGKTPPCADLIVRQHIPRVVVGCRDPFPQVDGRGIEKLQLAGIETIVGILERECRQLNRRFFTFHEQRRPYIILKWAESANRAIAGAGGEPVKISHPLSDRLVHRWRSEEAAIAVGAKTVLKDNPSLTTRFWPGRNPVRVIFGGNTALPTSARIFSEEARTIVFRGSESSLDHVLSVLWQENLQSLLVEGGTLLHEAFLTAGLWDELRIITNERLVLQDGYPAPRWQGAYPFLEQRAGTDRIVYYHGTEDILPLY
ncbi:bifunctional diaminohydroxyphosphoribosylaminopyrimidine deaminase/5-amino-6-(5-phosphoribosylamino)uracil reductase RibD [Flavihumibacter petaseus]|nr:bifunctional diaminohydroxyphosphoribosylaminopyrimidine deaminase/5-amino-6-(5-phosphoribosylamino)uracil reductase RibD [Flavihumibacter petaseus]